MAPLITVQLLTLDALGLAELLNNGKLTIVALVEQVLSQIDHEDKAGAKLNAVLNVAPRDILLQTASQLDDERKKGKLRSPYHGIPILIKDAIATHPDLGMPSTVGSFALLSSKPAQNAGIVDELIKKGLIILAKTNLNEGEAPIGHTSPLGSSTGSAVGVSAGYSPLSLGTETDGSLVQPAGRAALFALKPTVGSTDLTGVWTLSLSFDSAGAMAKSIVDLAFTTELLHTQEVRAKLPKDGYTSFLTKTFQGLKVGFLDPAVWHFPPRMCPQIPSVNSAYMNAIDKIRKAGAEVQYPVELPTFDKWMIADNQTAMSVIMFHDYKRNVDQYLSNLETSEVRSLKELIEWNKAHADIELPYVMRRPKKQGSSFRRSRLRKASTSCLSTRVSISSASHKTARYRAWPLRPVSESIFGFSGMYLDLIRQLRYPLATMPLGVLDNIGRPFALAIMARAGRGDLIFKFISAFEEAFPKRQIPPKLVRGDEEVKPIIESRISSNGLL
ncbi:amidase signature domain-containing protein [Lophiotrema nucula]|uniref:Amidase signature domain-containing protein n=1 Tax=Lophiotrema nucula TaxID=690887 RepID=A0A6A5YV51_9PLEO|nr:amidase signature domain-containing protein [Lophiotrema nucula]